MMQSYVQMRSGEEAYCPSSGELHANLPTCHTDRGLRDNREIEGICFDGGGKLTRIVPFIPHAPQASSKLAAYGVLMEGVGGGGTYDQGGKASGGPDGQPRIGAGVGPHGAATPRGGGCGGEGQRPQVRVTSMDGQYSHPDFL